MGAAWARHAMSESAFRAFFDLQKGRAHWCGRLGQKQFPVVNIRRLDIIC